MSLLPLDDAVTAVAGLGKDILDKIIPDENAAAAAALALEKLHQDGTLAKLVAETDLAKMQLTIDNTEAQSDSLFKSGWRPFLGWVCGGCFALEFGLRPFAITVAWLCGWDIDIPKTDMTVMLELLGALIGYRSFEKYTKTNKS